MVEPVRYSDTVTVRCQPGVIALVESAAVARGQKPSEYVRQALLTGLRSDGFDPATIAPRDAGTLYNVVGGQRCYALVVGDCVKHMSYSAEAPVTDGVTWLPVEHVDSGPFDISKHFRLPPIDRIEAGRVVREFPVVPKAWEHA